MLCIFKLSNELQNYTLTMNNDKNYNLKLNIDKTQIEVTSESNLNYIFLLVFLK